MFAIVGTDKFRTRFDLFKLGIEKPIWCQLNRFWLLFVSRVRRCIMVIRDFLHCNMGCFAYMGGENDPNGLINYIWWFFFSFPIRKKLSLDRELKPCLYRPIDHDDYLNGIYTPTVHYFHSLNLIFKFSKVIKWFF